MRTLSRSILLLFFLIVSTLLSAQEDYKAQIAYLNEQKERITQQEKEALKEEVEKINKRLERGELTLEEARILKEAAARRRALNIENRIAILDNKIALIERNEGDLLEENVRISLDDDMGFTLTINDDTWNVFRNRNRPPRYDRRTYSDLVLAMGFNNAIFKGESFQDTPYKVAGSRFFEIGWVWRTRVFKHTNFMRINYGFSFQFNGLKPKNNMRFLPNPLSGTTELVDFDRGLRKSKFRQDNLVIPVHLEFGPSKYYETEQRIRYSLNRQFRIGFGGYAGLNLGTRQKLKYTSDGGDRIKDKMKGGFFTNDFVYGISGYMGFDGVLLYVKYDLNPIFRQASAPEQQHISVGFRFDL